MSRKFKKSKIFTTILTIATTAALATPAVAQMEIGALYFYQGDLDQDRPGSNGGSVNVQGICGPSPRIQFSGHSNGTNTSEITDIRSCTGFVQISQLGTDELRKCLGIAFDGDGEPTFTLTFTSPRLQTFFISFRELASLTFEDLVEKAGGCPTKSATPQALPPVVPGGGNTGDNSTTSNRTGNTGLNNRSNERTRVLGAQNLGAQDWDADGCERVVVNIAEQEFSGGYRVSVKEFSAGHSEIGFSDGQCQERNIVPPHSTNLQGAQTALNTGQAAIGNLDTRQGKLDSECNLPGGKHLNGFECITHGKIN